MGYSSGLKALAALVASYLFAVLARHRRLAFETLHLGRQFGANVLDTPPVSFTGVKHRKGLLGWDYDGQIVLGSKISRKATVLGLSYGVSI